MKRADVLSHLRRQRERGPLPSSPADLASWIAGLQTALPLVDCPIPREAALPLQAQGVQIVESDSGARARFPADGDALDRVLALAGAPALPGGGAAALLDALEREGAEESPPPFSLPLRMRPAKASSLGWSPEVFSLTVLISNARLRQSDGALESAGPGPVVAICAEYEQPLVSLDPPRIAGYPFARAREQGMPTLRLRAGLLSRALRLEATSRTARAPQGRAAALARAWTCLGELDAAWKRERAPAVEVAWPVYRSEHTGKLLDAVVGSPLPAMELA
jgi:hypothetical protein